MNKAMPSIISIVGHSNAGKTTLVVKLVAELRKRGYRIGTIKHASHGYDIEKQGKDSWQHKEAGADTVLVVAPGRIAMMKDVSSEKIADFEHYFYDLDLILTEGFKREKYPKIEIFRVAGGAKPLNIQQNLLAFVTDSDEGRDVPTFGLDEVGKLADLVESGYLKN